VEVSQGLDDLLGQLDATNARGRHENKLRRDDGPRIPYTHDLEQMEWRPLPKLDAVRQTLQAGASRKFVSYSKNIGYAMSEPKYVDPKVLDYWTSQRAMQPERTYKYPKIAPPRFHSQPELLPETTDQLLGEQHRDWLQKHKLERTAKLYPVAHNIDKVAEAQKKYEGHRKMRETTTDIITRQPRGSNAPGTVKLGEHAKKGLAKALTMAKTNRAFNHICGRNPLSDDEKRDYNLLLKAKSAPSLQFKERVPDCRIEHLRSFQYTTAANRSLRTSTPWQHYDEVQDLRELGRRTW